MDAVEKSKERKLKARTAIKDLKGSSKLYEEFQNLETERDSDLEAYQSAVHDLKWLAENCSQTVEELLLEAHTSPHTNENHREALSLERMIGYFRR